MALYVSNGILCVPFYAFNGIWHFMRSIHILCVQWIFLFFYYILQSQGFTITESILYAQLHFMPHGFFVILRLKILQAHGIH